MPLLSQFLWVQIQKRLSWGVGLRVSPEGAAQMWAGCRPAEGQWAAFCSLGAAAACGPCLLPALVSWAKATVSAQPGLNRGKP